MCRAAERGLARSLKEQQAQRARAMAAKRRTCSALLSLHALLLPALWLPQARSCSQVLSAAVSGMLEAWVARC
jgi:hypothetical protein